MRDTAAVFTAGCVLLLCLPALTVLLAYISSGNHGASLSNMGLPLLMVVWGGVSALGVVFQRAWGHKSFVVCGSTSSVLACIFGVAGDLPWSNAVPLAAGLLLATLTVGWRPHAAR